MYGSLISIDCSLVRQSPSVSIAFLYYRTFCHGGRYVLFHRIWSCHSFLYIFVLRVRRHKKEKKRKKQIRPIKLYTCSKWGIVVYKFCILPTTYMYSCFESHPRVNACITFYVANADHCNTLSREVLGSIFRQMQGNNILKILRFSNRSPEIRL